MEKIAIISDVHGNITALKAVFLDIEKRNIKRVFCLGDITAKLPNSDLVIDMIKEKCEVVLKGNCDEIISSPEIKKGRFWTRDRIGEKRAEYLYNLPVMYEFYLSGHLIRLFHSSPFSLSHIFNPMFKNINTKYKDIQISSPDKLFENTEFIGKTSDDKIPDMIGYGHLHTPNIFRWKNKTIFNPGSVGAPTEMSNNDKVDETSKFSTMASYIILEGEYDLKSLAGISINLVRVPYDIKKEIENLKKSDMPGKEDAIKMLLTAWPY